MTRARALIVSILVVALLITPLAGVAAAAQAPSGMVSIPDKQISEDVPSGESIPVSASAFENGGVLSSAHASSMSLTLTTASHADEVIGSNAVSLSSDKMVLVLSDDTHHDGRRVAIEATALRQALGYLPKTVDGLHDDGSRWTRTVRYEDGFVVFEVPEFSSNIISFGGETSISAMSATDGSTFTYNLSSVDSVSNFSATVTGREATETDTETGASYIGGSFSAGVGGSGDPTNATLSLTGYRESYTKDYSLQLAPSTERNIGYTGWVESVEVTVRDNYADTDSFEANISVDGTQFASCSVGTSGTTKTCVADGADLFSDTTTTVNVSASSSELYLQQIKINGRAPQNVTASIGGSTISFGSFLAGETTTKSIPLTQNATTVSLSGTGGGGMDYVVEYTEHQLAAAAGLTVNGNQSSTTGTLSAGESVSIPTDASWLQAGENTVKLSLSTPDGSISADDPAPIVDLAYRHASSARQSVNYTSTQWSERYNASYHYASAKSDAELSIPFASNVVSLGEIEKRVGGGSWTAVSDSATTFNNGTLTVGLGGVSADTAVEVRASGVKVGVDGGRIKVLDPSETGKQLDSKLKVTSVNASRDLVLNVGGTPSGNLTHYTYSESWDATEYVLDSSSSGQHLVLPDAAAGDTMRVSTIPVKATPKTGDVAIRVPNPAQTTPQFVVEPGNVAGDTVKYTFTAAIHDTKYILYSETRDVVLDSGTAHSPLTLIGDDDSGTLEFQTEGSDKGNSDDGGNTLPPGILGPMGSTTTIWDALGAPLTIVSIAGALAGFWVVRRRYGGKQTRAANTSGPLSFAARGVTRGARWLVANPRVGLVASTLAVIGLVATGIVSVPSGAVPAAFTVVAPLGSYLVLGRLGDRSLLVWGIVAAISAVVGLSWMGVGIIDRILTEQTSILIVLVGAYIAYKAVQAYQSPDKVQRFVFRGSSGDSGGDRK